MVFGVGKSNSPEYTLYMKPYSLAIIACLIITLVAGLLLLNQNQATQPVQIQDHTSTSSIQLTAARDRVLFPAQCVWVSWQLEGIREVYLNGHGKVGQGAEESCTVGKPPTFKVIFQDGREVDYPLPVIQAYSTPLGLLSLAAFIISLAALAGLLIGPRALLVVLVVVVFGPLLRAQVNLGQDYIDHDMFATVAMSDPRALPPHFLYHISTIALFQSQLVPNIENGGYWVMLLAYIGTALATYQLLLWLNRRRPEAQVISGYIWTIAVLILMLHGPISVVASTFKPGQTNAFLFANTYHNPTISLLKPLAIVLFFIVLKMITDPQRRTALLAMSATCLTALATLAKPSYTIAIVPAVALVIGYSFLKPLRIKRLWLGIAILGPAAIVLIWQFMFLYGPQHISLIRAESGSIIFAPFDYFITINHVTFGWLLLDLAASILFPTLIFIFYWRESRNDIALNLSWLVFLITLAQAYFFNEKPDGSHGNLTWGTQIGLFILFAVSHEYLIYKAAALFRNHQRVNWQLITGGIVLLMHLVNNVGLLLSG